MMSDALLLIDIQNDYFRGGKMELVNMENASKNARQLLDKFRQESLPIFHIQHFSIRPDANFFIPNTKGVDIHDDVTPLANEIIIAKHYPNSFRDTDLQQKLQQNNIKKLVIGGAMSHMCIDSTTRAAFDLGYSCTIIKDACATKDLSMNNEHISAQQVHFAYMAGLNGLFAKVISLTELDLK